MAQRLLFIGGLVGLFVLASGGAGAKTPSYVISGGELGPYAYQFFGFMDNGEPAEVDLAPEWPGSRQVEPPVTRPSLAYDMYASYGNFAVPYQIANGGPELRFYPEVGLLHARSTDEWYQLAPDVAEFLEGVIRDALAKKDAGELEIGPIAADFRARSLDRVSYRFQRYPEDGFMEADIDQTPWFTHSADARIGGPASQAFAMEHLVQTVSRPPAGPSNVPPEFVITYSGSSIGGILGFYLPTRDGEPGRFWHDGYVYDKSTPYYETTPGFDALVEEALPSRLAGQQSEERTAATGGDGLSSALIAAIAAGVVVLAATAGGVFILRRARARP